MRYALYHGSEQGKLTLKKSVPMVRNPMPGRAGACETASATEVPVYRASLEKQQRYGLQECFRATLTETASSHAEVAGINGNDPYACIAIGKGHITQALTWRGAIS
jgi:hypothetical protein